MTTALFWVITHTVVVIPYRRFGTIYRSYFQGSRFPYRRFRIRWHEKLARNDHYAQSINPGKRSFVPLYCVIEQETVTAPL